ncbi:MAG: 1,4-alpha-glucan branching protein GlgB [bacterium]
MIIDKLSNEFYYHFFGGTLNNAYEYFGAHLKKRDNEIVGCEFLVYAPNATKVCLIGEFNNFKEQLMEEIKKGFYYIYIEKNIEYLQYKYVIHTKTEILYKADPYAFYAQLRPGNDSIVYDITKLNKKEYKRENDKNKPMSIYEVHLGSWKNRFPKYNELDELINYLKDNNFTHLEILPIYEHPLDESWGYMGTGYYAPTSRYGQPHEFLEFINSLHENNIKIILDWVPGHICRDSFGLYKFDGSYLYEYDYYDIRENIEWGTANLDFSKGITRSFLISNCMYYLKYYNIDGFRVDAVRNLIYYLGNENRGINNSSINFLKQLNKIIKEYDENVITTAEDSSAYLGVTHKNGLGFDYKWNMGWMNDTLKYFELDFDQRKYNHHLITFGLSYVFNENYILPISHDEVVHLKKSLFTKMKGNYFEKFSSLRLFLGLMFTHPGKKLLFMGSEFGVTNEWCCNDVLNFSILKEQHNQKIHKYFKDLNYLYVNELSLHNDNASGFNFIDCSNDKSIFIYQRKYKDEEILVVINALPILYNNYKIGVSSLEYKEIFNSDNQIYGGENHLNNYVLVIDGKYHNQKNCIDIKVPPLSIVILKSTK